MKVFKNIREKFSGQQSMVSGDVAKRLKNMLPGQQSPTTPVIDFIKDKVPSQQNADGPVRKLIRNVMNDEEAETGSGKMFGSEIEQETPMGNVNMFGNDYTDLDNVMFGGDTS